jgi:hypothetical protein
MGRIGGSGRGGNGKREGNKSYIDSRESDLTIDSQSRDTWIVSVEENE